MVYSKKRVKKGVEEKMFKKLTLVRGNSLSEVLTYTDLRSYLFTLLFVGLSIAVPMVFHQFNLAGPTFLPMQIFVLAAGLIFGWRAGLIIGVTSPLISYAITGMPMMTILPQTVVELTTYGFAAGMLREKTNLRTIWALVAAMAAGRVALLAVVTVFHFGRAIYSPLGIADSPLAVVWASVSQGWPGIVIQLAALPFIVKYGQKLLGKSA